jgi:hypothetical protein
MHKLSYIFERILMIYEKRCLNGVIFNWICEGDASIRLEDVDVEIISKMLPAEAQRYLLQTVCPKLSPEDRKVLKTWIDNKIPLGEICKPPLPNNQIKRKQ